MKYTIRQPQSFTEIGRKDNQEDFLWPAPQTVTTDQRIFIVCDGVGGQDNGEVASATAATALGTYLTSHWPEDGIATRELFEAALAYAYDELDKADNEDTVRKMATTMTCVILHRGGALVAHIGDSRIYHIRPSVADTATGDSSILYQSYDHSLVNDLLRVGELTEEEARDFPQKNIITRAMQPHGERRCRADIYNLDDVKSGDYFFLCSDGVLEQVTNDALVSIVCSDKSDEAKVAAIKAICDGRTRDNNTCYLVPIESVTLEAGDETHHTAIVMDAPSEAPKNVSRCKAPAQADDCSNATCAADEEAAVLDAEEMSRKHEEELANIQKRKESKRNTIIVGALVIAAVASVCLYKAFFSTPLDPRYPNPFQPTEADAQENVESPADDAIDEQEPLKPVDEEPAPQAEEAEQATPEATPQAEAPKAETTEGETNKKAPEVKMLEDKLKSMNTQKAEPASETKAPETPAEH